ncbi:MAG: hypothetical protein RL199_277 [Pseudomonadota bacterium]|jgi:hypothetical protein
MLRPLLVALLVPVVLLGAHCSRKAAAPAPAQPFSVVVTAGLVGHLEPCGCSRDQKGGVARAAAAVEALRQEGRAVLLVDGGDRFFPEAAAPSDPLVAARRTLEASTMAAVTRAMKYDALVVGDRDANQLASIAPLLTQPLVDTGAGSPQTKQWSMHTVAGRRVALVAASSAETIAARVPAARHAGAELVVLVVYLPPEQAKALQPAASAAGADVVIATRADVPETHESGSFDGPAPMFAVAARGQELLRLDFLLDAPAGTPLVRVVGRGEREADLSALQQRIDLLRGEVRSLNPLSEAAKLRTDKLLELERRKSALAAAPPPSMPAGKRSFAHAFVAMTPGVAADEPVQKQVDAFHADAGRKAVAYLAEHPRACPRPVEGRPSFAGQASCVDCHEEAAAHWKTTPHARAYESLVKRGREHDVACIGCHVVGYEQPGGACSIVDVKGREDVQCESCHGPGSTHAEEGTKATMTAKVPEATCRKCHDPENSPHFNDGTYRPQILGPGHGAPAAVKAAGKGT